MQYLLLIYGAEDAAPAFDSPEGQAEFAEWMGYSERLGKAGAMEGGNALQPVATATTVRVRDGEDLITDGPFAETKEVLGGYYLIDVPDLDSALAWASRCRTSATARSRSGPSWSSTRGEPRPGPRRRPAAGARAGGAGRGPRPRLPRRGAAGPRLAHPPPGRLPARRGRPPGRLRRRGHDLAARRRPAQRRGLADRRRAAARARPPAAGARRRRPRAGARPHDRPPPRRSLGRGAARPGRGPARLPGRPPAPRLHVLPPGARAGGPRRADAARRSAG